MGMLRPEHLNIYTPADGTKPLERAPNSNVGSMHKHMAVGVVRIGKKGGEWTLLGDVPANVFAGHLELEGRDGIHARWRWEVLVPNGAGIHAGDTLTIADYPWSTHWRGVTKFRGGRRPALEKVLAEIAEHDDPFAVEEARRDETLMAYNSKNPQLLAAISDPGLAAFGGSDRLERGKHLYVFGSCRDPEQAVQDLLNHPERHLQRLVQAALAGHIQDPFVRLKEGTSAATLVPKGARDEAHLQSVLDLSLMQALAGPADDHAAYRDAPLRDLVASIFCDHLSRARKTYFRSLDRHRKAIAKQAEARRDSDVAGGRDEPDSARIEALARIDTLILEDPSVRARACELLLAEYHPDE